MKRHIILTIEEAGWIVKKLSDIALFEYFKPAREVIRFLSGKFDEVEFDEKSLIQDSLIN